jgi:hypothetical protein
MRGFFVGLGVVVIGVSSCGGESGPCPFGGPQGDNGALQSGAMYVY